MENAGPGKGRTEFEYYIQGGPINGPFLKVYNSLYNDIGRRSIYQNVQLFIRSKTDILNAVFKYFLHKIRETMLH